MRTLQKTCGYITARWRLTAASLTVLLGLSALAGDLQWPVLRTRTGTFTNVTVLKVSKTDIFITHMRGVANIKISNLDGDILQRLGLSASPSQPSAPARTASEAAKVEKPAQAASIAELESAPIANSPVDPKMARAQVFLAALSSFRLARSIFATIVAVFLVLYLFLCYCWKQICEKTGNPPGVLIWIPILQMFPLLRAAGMSGWWFVALLIPFLNVVALIVWLIVWPIKIVQARGKSGWVAVMLILPITNPFAILYLAFSSADDDDPKEVLINIPPRTAALGEA